MSRWTCRTSGPTASNRRRAEVVFSSPHGEAHNGHSLQSQAFGPLEVYLRQLGKAKIHREAGWKVCVPKRHKKLPGWLRRGRQPDRFRYLEIRDPRNRRTLLELKDPPTEDLLEQLRAELFEELEDAEEQRQGEGQLEPGPVPQGHQDDHRQLEPAPHQGQPRLEGVAAEVRTGQERLEEWLRHRGLVLDDGPAAATG